MFGRLENPQQTRDQSASSGEVEPKEQKIQPRMESRELAAAISIGLNFATRGARTRPRIYDYYGNPELRRPPPRAARPEAFVPLPGIVSIWLLPTNTVAAQRAPKPRIKFVRLMPRFDCTAAAFSHGRCRDARAVSACASARRFIGLLRLHNLFIFGAADFRNFLIMQVPSMIFRCVHPTLFRIVRS